MKQNFGIYTDLYNSAINDLDSGRFLPNIKAVRKQIADAKKSIRILTNGVVFCQDLDMLAKTERNLQRAKDKLNALNAVYEYIRKKYNV